MPVILEANYSKKIGLPGYSSHQYSITLRTEISDLTQISAESQRLYGLLQGCVDRDIQATGFLPKNGEAQHRNGNGRVAKNGSEWGCSDKQRDLILKIIDDNRLDKQEVESLAVERFGKGVKLLNKMEASGLIEELLEAHPQQQPRSVAPRRNGNGNGRFSHSRA